MIDIKLSQRIFDVFMAGKVINSYKLSDGDVSEPCPLYNEITINLDDYKLHYHRCGSELQILDGCYFIRSQNEEKSHVEVAAKIQALLIVIGRAVTLDNYELGVLFDNHGGLTKAMVTKINQNDDFRSPVLAEL